MKKLSVPNTKYSERSAKQVQLRPNWMYDEKPYLNFTPRSLSEAEDNQRLKNVLRRVVNKHEAPQQLIDSIRLGIRRCGDGG